MFRKIGITNVILLILFRAKPTEKQQWISAIQNHQDFLNPESQILLCELHFNGNAITKRKDRNILTKGTYPTIFPGKQKDSPESCTSLVENTEKSNE